MKLLYFIFAFYILILSVKPCCIYDNCEGEINSHNTEQTENSGNNNDCKGNCSPFFTCGICSGFTFSDTFIFFQNFPASVVKNIIFIHQQFVENYFAKIWQPPKIS